MTEINPARNDEDVMDEQEYAELYPDDLAEEDRPEWLDEPPARFKEQADVVRGHVVPEHKESAIQTEEKPDGTCRITVTAPHHKDYKVETRSNGSGGLELVLFDSEGREFIESFGTQDELVELNAMAALYAKSIHAGDELGRAFVDFLDSKDVPETI
jgi:hypothetical protein